MPRTTRPDGAEIYWEAHGDGPAVVLAPHAWGIPELFEPLIRDLERDHRVIRYDARGSGRSSHQGPHDLQTGADDLVAVIADVGGPAVVVGLADAPNGAVRATVEHPELVTAVVALGTVPIARSLLAGTEALVASPTVVDAFLEMISTDYRGGMRPLMTAANPQLSEAEVRERIDRLVAYTPQDVAAARLRAWADDDAGETSRALGDRLWILTSPDTAGPWFPPIEVMDRVLRELIPDAHRLTIEDGIVSRPDITAGVVRGITANVRVPSR
jgi:pimeloyl-ACP methyl ester carboxylesterase